MPVELSSAVKRDAKFWRLLGDKCVNLLKRITDKGVDFEGNAFPDYSQAYAESKARSRPKKNPGTKAAGAGKGQASRRTNPPDLRFSGGMMRDLKTSGADANGSDIGWATFGDRVSWNADMGRAIIDLANDADPHPQLTAAVLEAIAIDTDEKLEKWAREPIDITIGKR
jgi:hypothetical protein